MSYKVSKMDLHLIMFLSVFGYSYLLANVHGYKFPANFWQTFTPGELLNQLDLMTNNEVQNRRSFMPLTIFTSETTTPIPTTTQTATISKTLEKRNLKNIKNQSEKNNEKHSKSKPTKRLLNKEDNIAAATSNSASNENDDYERKYEEFVSRYFDDAADHYLQNENDEEEPNSASISEEASNLSGSIEREIVEPFDAQTFKTSPSTASKKSKKNCRKIYKNGETCLICKNSRNGERSEVCSYEHSSDPESYAYERQQKYKKSRDSNDDDDDDSENSSADVAESKLAIQTVKPPATLNDNKFNETLSNSSCIKRITGEKACHYCRNGSGELKVNCFLLTAPLKDEKSSKAKPLKNDNKTHKKRRVFKRTLSYVFEKALDSNGTLNLPPDFTANSTELLE